MAIDSMQLLLRAADAGRTPDEQVMIEEAEVMIEEAENCERLAAKHRRLGATKDAQDFEDAARQWRLKVDQPREGGRQDGNG